MITTIQHVKTYHRTFAVLFFTFATTCRSFVHISQNLDSDFEFSGTWRLADCYVSSLVNDWKILGWQACGIPILVEQGSWVWEWVTFDVYIFPLKSNCNVWRASEFHKLDLWWFWATLEGFRQNKTCLHEERLCISVFTCDCQAVVGSAPFSLHSFSANSLRPSLYIGIPKCKSYAQSKNARSQDLSYFLVARTLLGANKSKKLLVTRSY